MTGQQADLRDSTSALTLLHKVLSSLPTAMEYRLTDLNIDEQGQVNVRAEVRTHGGGHQLAAALQTNSFRVEQPVTWQIGDNLVAVELSAAWGEQDEGH